MKRLKQFLTLMAFLTIGSQVMAQSKTQFAVGLKAGPNFARLNTDANAGANYNNRTGFHAGAFMLLRGERVGFQPEVIFSQQGATGHYSGQPDLKSNFSYVNIPLIVKLYTVAGINLQVGPQFGFLTSAKSNYDPSSNQLLPSERDVKDAYNKSDVSLALGVGWDLPFGFSIDGRYNWGLSDINSGAGGTVKNQVWQFSVGYKFLKF